MQDNYWMRRTSQRFGRRGFLATSGALGAGAAALALAGCGDDDSGKTATAQATSGGGASTTAAAPSPTVDVSKLSDADFFARIPDNPPKDWKDEDIKSGGQFVRFNNRELPSYDFHAGVAGAIVEMTTPIYSGLVRFSSRQGMKDVYAAEIEGDLASSWEQPDRTTLIFTLNPGIKYQPVDPVNGRDFKVDDIAYSFNRAKTFAKSLHKYPYSFFDKVEDVGGGKVKVTLAKPTGSALAILSAWIGRIMPPEVGDNPDNAARKPAGTGGFILDKVTPNVGSIYRKHPSFFKKDKQGRQLPYLDGYNLALVVDPATRSAQFEGGQADMHYGPASPLSSGITGLRDFMKRNPTAVVQKLSPFYGTYTFLPHYDRPPFSDPRVRRALSMAYDRQTVLDKLSLSQGTTVPYFPWVSVLDKKPALSDLGPNYKYDPKQAKALLSAAGFPNGIEVEVIWAYQADDQVLLYQQYAADAGVKLNLVMSVDQNAHIAKYLSKSWKDLMYIGRGMNYPDVNEFAQYYTPGNPFNYNDVNDPDFTALIQKQEVADGPDRKVLHKQMWDRLLDQMYDIPQPSGDGLQFTSAHVKNIVNTGWGSQGGGYGMGSLDSAWRSG